MNPTGGIFFDHRYRGGNIWWMGWPGNIIPPGTGIGARSPNEIVRKWKFKTFYIIYNSYLLQQIIIDLVYLSNKIIFIRGKIINIEQEFLINIIHKMFINFPN